MKIIAVNFFSQFLEPPYTKSITLQEACKLSNSMEFNAGTISGLFEVLLSGINSAASHDPACCPELAKFEINSTVGDDVFELNARVLLKCGEVRKDLHNLIFARLRAVFYSPADFEKAAFSESPCNIEEGA